MNVTVSVTIDGACCCGGRRPWGLKTFGPVSEQIIKAEEEMPMEAKLTDTQQADFEYPKPVDKKGHEAPVQDGSVVLASTDATVATVAPDTANPYKGTIVAVGPGTCRVNVSADADLGDGVATIVGVPIDVTVSGGMAVGFGEPSVSAPVEQP